MRNFLLACLLFPLLVSSASAGTKLIFTSNLDDTGMPVDNLTEIPFIADRQYLMFLYSDNGQSFGVEEINFEVFIYDEESGEYKFDDMYSVASQPEWLYCYKGIFFNGPMKVKVIVSSSYGDLVTEFVEVVE